MLPAGRGERRAAAGTAGAANFRERDREPEDGPSPGVQTAQTFARTKFCRAGCAGRGMAFA